MNNVTLCWYEVNYSYMHVIFASICATITGIAISNKKQQQINKWEIELAK